jgi:hypothetical protein
VAITAELIAVRRHCERELPHLSWFHGKKLDLDETSERTTEVAEEP